MTSPPHRPWNRTWTFAYDAAGRRTWLGRPNGVTTSYSYDAAGQLTTIDHTGIGLWQYTYDQVGNRTQMSTPTGTHTYAYDATDRLASATHPTGPIESYSYDQVGNRLTDATASYSYDAANRLLSKTGVSYTWDNNGNLTGKTEAGGPTTYRYDGDNRLVEVQRGGATVARFTYDPFGRRVSKTTATGAVYYVYDGEDILAEVDGAGALLTYYVHGPGIDEPLAMVKVGQTYYYHADALGTITHLTSSSGAIVQSYDYDSFGNITTQSGTLSQPYTYTGREWDAETGLYYYRARYYDPGAGRFITEDPIGQAGGINLYSYVRNVPTRYTDPTGTISAGCAYVACVAGVLAANYGGWALGCVVGCCEGTSCTTDCIKDCLTVAKLSNEALMAVTMGCGIVWGGWDLFKKKPPTPPTIDPSKKPIPIDKYRKKGPKRECDPCEEEWEKAA